MAEWRWNGDDKECSEGEYSNGFEEYDCYGKTPPRTRWLRKIRDRKNREKENFGFLPRNSPKMAKKLITRRNTITSMFDDMITKADNIESEQGKRIDKRSIKLLRGSERDLKLDIASAQMIVQENGDSADGQSTQQPRRVESCRRFMSLCSKRVTSTPRHQAVRATCSLSQSLIPNEGSFECPQSRVDFHKTLSMLIRMGSGEKTTNERNTRRHLSREEIIWQTELKDIIWLELQAWHADRTPSEQDAFLCQARESVAVLLNNIMTYKFQHHSRNLLAQSGESNKEDNCPGCLSMYCKCCMEAQNDALHEIEELMTQLEEAESLFPSSRAFAEIYPLFNSPEFVGRVKAMCLWYNMTKHQRLKLVILGKLLALLENKYYQWPIQYDGNSVDSSSPTDSNSSNSSVNDYLNDKTTIDLYNIGPIATLVSKKNENNASPYRKYIENILKTRGLAKSLSFLDRLHLHVLRKSQITLQKPENDKIFETIPGDNQDEELYRYGSWSPEARSLALPSYKAAFLFLSAVPLEVIHEFLRMRLEQKPEKPSPLSVRQLMRELKEGIRIASSQRERILEYMSAVVDENEERLSTYKSNVDTFDSSLKLVFKDYLDYLSTWALLQHDTFQKSLLEEEWNFVCDNVRNIPEGYEMAAAKFCSILGSMLNSVGLRMMARIEEFAVEVCERDDDFNRKQNLFAVCRELQSLFNDEREMSIKIISFAKSIFKMKMHIDNVEEFKTAVLALKCTIPKAIERVQNMCDDNSCMDNMDEAERISFMSRCREILMQGYRFGFEFHKEMSDFVPAERKPKLARSMVQFAHLWMKFARERCERGRGKRPRWAYQGLEFLLTVCEPQYTRFLSEAEFEELKHEMDTCISHVIGTTAPSTPDSGFHSASPRPSLELGRFPRSRGSSPSPRPTYKSQRSAGRKTSVEQNSPVNDQIDSPNFNFNRKEESLHDTLIKIKQSPTLRRDRIKDAVYQLDVALDANLRKDDLIGTVVRKQPDGVKHVRRRNVTFCWQRGIKIGQGRFGKVYTAVNNDTGEMMAVKEVLIQHNDVGSIRKIAEEIKIMEGITHKYLVKYYGLEVHKEEMLIFMEFCPEGTLESLIAGTECGLPELLIRRYTFQLLSGVAVLHEHGIVHRDLKTANIFLTDEGNCLKIGDFGCAVKIKSHATMPGELQGFVGTQAYMAPEMFMKTSVEGHGRSADIWSVGCVVVEMASGKRPWAEYDSNYQIMFKVGMGEKPEAPDSLIDEGHEFLERCLQHEPRKRSSALELLNHNFVKAGDDFI